MLRKTHYLICTRLLPKLMLLFKTGKRRVCPRRSSLVASFGKIWQRSLRLLIPWRFGTLGRDGRISWTCLTVSRGMSKYANGRNPFPGRKANHFAGSADYGPHGACHAAIGSFSGHVHYYTSSLRPLVLAKSLTSRRTHDLRPRHPQPTTTTRLHRRISVFAASFKQWLHHSTVVPHR